MMKLIRLLKLPQPIMNATWRRTSQRARILRPATQRGVQTIPSRTILRTRREPTIRPRKQTKVRTELQSRPPIGLSPRILTIMGVSMLGLTTYCSFLYASYQREVSASKSLNVPTDVSDRYNRTAPTFDADVELAEKTMRLGKKRADLISLARGNVLEVSCGTGRNLEYYKLGQQRGTDHNGRAAIVGCRSLTLVDLSPQMVEMARQKFEALYPEYNKGAVAFRAQDAASVSVVLPASAGYSPIAYYDTIVQTMGLCSMPDPVGTLRHLGSITEPMNGRILLLEHGRSKYDWLNRILDDLAPAHADRHGCWWNRDIRAIVRESGLEVVEEKRWHFGTTWKYVLRPRQDSS